MMDEPIDPRCTPTQAEIDGLREQLATAGEHYDTVLEAILKTYRVPRSALRCRRIAS